MRYASDACQSTPVPGTHRPALHHGLPTGLGNASWEHPAAGRCHLAASPGVQRWVPRTPQALGTGRDPRKGLLLVPAEGLPWGRGPSNPPGRSRGAPGLPRDGAFPTLQAAQSSWQGKTQAAARGAELSSSRCPVMSTSISQPNPSPSPFLRGPCPRQPPPPSQAAPFLPGDGRAALMGGRCWEP